MDNKSKRREFLLNRIYEELKQANTNRIYAELLIDRQIINSKLFNIFIASFSTGGAIFYFIETYIALAASVVIAIGAVLNQFYPVFFLKTDEFTKLVRLHTDYTIYLNKLQNLFEEADSGDIGIDEAQRRYSELYENNAKKATEISSIFGKMIKKLENETIKKSDEYLNGIYN